MTNRLGVVIFVGQYHFSRICREEKIRTLRKPTKSFEIITHIYSGIDAQILLGILKICYFIKVRLLFQQLIACVGKKNRTSLQVNFPFKTIAYIGVFTVHLLYSIQYFINPFYFILHCSFAS